MKKTTMKKRVRLMLLTVAGFLAYLATAQTSFAWCEAQCWENDGGQICCTTYWCTDYCS